MTSTPGPLAVVERLRDATNAHDLDALVGCFAADYVNQTPAHPARGFTGRDQVRRNWTQILGGVPDLHTEIRSASVEGAEVWSEWEMRGTRRDGSRHLMRGVIVFTVGDLIDSARFYLEPVVDDTDVDGAVRRQVGGSQVGPQ